MQGTHTHTHKSVHTTCTATHLHAHAHTYATHAAFVIHSSAEQAMETSAKVNLLG